MMVIEGTVTFDENDPIYRKHFPRRPVVPGSLISAAFIDLLKKNGMETIMITRARFLHFAVPATYRYSVSVKDNHATWELRADDNLFAEGEFVVHTREGVTKGVNG
jgi:3-hydroxymyristoyl/3-hydroxydecanoyl-(acyl carrier protein) dehydratase